MTSPKGQSCTHYSAGLAGDREAAPVAHALPDRQALPVVVALSRFGLLAWRAWTLGTRLALPDLEGRASREGAAAGLPLGVPLPPLFPSPPSFPVGAENFEKSENTLLGYVWGFGLAVVFAKYSYKRNLVFMAEAA